MKQQLLFFLACIGLVIASCKAPKEESSEEGQAPGYVQHEMLMTRNAVTGEVEGQKVWDYLLSVKPRMGRIQQHGKRKVYPNSWRAIDDFFANLAVQRLVYDPNTTTTMYFCTGEGWNNADASRGAGVWKSTDGGETWLQLPSTNSDTFWYCHDMLIHPVTSDVYVATRRQGLMRSKDGGNSWERVLGQDLGAIENATTDIEITADNELFVCIGNFSTDGIYFSATGDANDWEKRMNGFPTAVRRIELTTAPSNANVVYAVPTSSIRLDSNRIVGVYRSADKGLNWDTLALPGGNRDLSRLQGWYDLIIKVSPEDENVVLIGGLNVFRTTDGGASWQQLFEGRRNRKSTLQYAHVDQHEILFKTGDTVLLGNDGGIYRCDDILADTPYLYSINDNYNVTQFYSCAAEAKPGGGFVIGGTQDNGSLGSQDVGISEFKQLSWADGSYCNIDYTDPDIFYTTTQYRRLYRTNHGDVDTLTNGNIVNNNTLFINPIEMDPNDPQLLYQLTNRGLWRLKNARTATKEDWEKGCRNFGSFSAIGISKSSPNTVFVGRAAGSTIYRIDNANTSDETFLPINCDPNTTLPSSTSAYCSSVFVDPEDGNHVLVTYSNYGIESVWETNNALDANPVWMSHEGNLPDVPIRWVVLHPTNPEVCYLATQVGVMMTTKLDGANTQWTLINGGMANLKVNMLRLRSNDLTLVAATHGRGIFTGKIQSDYSVKWEERGPMNVGGRTRTILFDPNDPSGKKLWAGSVSGGLWVAQNWDSIQTYTEIQPEEFSVKVGANPIQQNRISIYVSAEKNRNLHIELFSETGQKVYERKSPVQIGSNAIIFKDLDCLVSSMYFLRITSADGIKEVFKLITL